MEDALKRKNNQGELIPSNTKNVMIIINNIIYFKVAKKLDFKFSYHKKEMIIIDLIEVLAVITLLEYIMCQINGFIP